VFAGVALVEHRPWFVASARPWLDPWTLEAAGIALAVANLAWLAARTVCRRTAQAQPEQTWLAAAHRRLASPWLARDRATSLGLVGLPLALAGYAALPGALQELSPRVAAGNSPAVAAPVADESSASESAGSPRVVPPIERFEWPGIDHRHAVGWGAWS